MVYLSSYLRNHEEQVMNLQSILLWNKPIQFILGIAFIDSLLIFYYVSQIGIISFIFFLLIIFYSIYLLQYKYHISKFLINYEIKNKAELKSIDEICKFFDNSKKLFNFAYDYLLGTQFYDGIIKIAFVLTVWITIAFVLNIIGKFWIYFIIINTCLILPGLLLNPFAKQKINEGTKYLKSNNQQ